MVSWNLINISSDYGLLPVRHQAITRTNDESLYFELNFTVVFFLWVHLTFFFIHRKCICVDCKMAAIFVHFFGFNVSNGIKKKSMFETKTKSK